jgi:Rrf2 family nitric oxide-sensitive transcriptional repressor
MRLTAYTDYALRVLIRLALQPQRLTTIADIAKGYGISENHLMKVVHQLGVSGDVETVRGRNGGVRLAKPAASINLGAVVRRTEADMELVPCFADAELCAIGGACKLRTALREALAAFLAVLDRYSLADLVAPRRWLAFLLGIELSRNAGFPSRTGLAP